MGNVALLVPDYDAIQQQLQHHDNNNTSYDEESIVNNVNFQTLITNEIQSCCCKAKLKKYEIPQKWSIVSPFTVANNMLTPKLSIRRYKVIQFYYDIIESMYDDNNDNNKDDCENNNNTHHHHRDAV